MVNLTSAEVNWVPSWNLTSGRSLNSQDLSPVAFQEVATRGIRFRSGSRDVSVSNRLKVQVISAEPVLICGSSFEMSDGVAMISSVLLAGAFEVALPVLWTAAAGAGPAAPGTAAPAGLAAGDGEAPAAGEAAAAAAGEAGAAAGAAGAIVAAGAAGFAASVGLAAGAD